MFIRDPVKVEIVTEGQQKVTLLLNSFLHYPFRGDELEWGGVRGVGHTAPITKKDHVDVLVCIIQKTLSYVKYLCFKFFLSREGVWHPSSITLKSIKYMYEFK